MIITNEIKPLKRLSNPPKKLYYKGNLQLLNLPKISIVGSRKMSVYTKNIIIALSSALKKRGVCIVSGAAIGCDITAHIGAYPNTIAVFGNGLDILYPKSNAKIIKQIYENSLAISEYEPDTPARNYQFLQRNRIVVALCEVLVVAQADLKSGSMQSAGLANELGIPVFVLPQRINESRGTNLLLRENRASLIDDIDVFANKFKNSNFLSDDKDEFLNFVKYNQDLNAALDKFADLVYEYELEGKIEISGMKIIIRQ